ncbi:DUF4347 domain-containing protein, partial [Sulfurisoma sediminicola]|uniref:DUF4347 domain-containing protein n=1 Tax=Sulfurisoma sediminicola TaxID=1381557 RepID=UPI001472A142
MGNSIVFVDWRVADIDSLLAGMPSGTEIFIIDGASAGLDQIVASLHGRTGVDAIHIISHGSSGTLYLGDTALSQSNLNDYGSQLSTIGSALTETGDLLLYGCGVGAGDTGVQFIGSLAQATGADVAASTDLTGAVALGGNWSLEATTGPVQTPYALADTYPGTLASTTLSVAEQQPNYDLVRTLAAAELSNVAYLQPFQIRNKLSELGWAPLRDPSHLLDVGGGLAKPGLPAMVVDRGQVFNEDVNNAYAFAASREMPDGTVQFAVTFRGSDSMTEDPRDWLWNNGSQFGFSYYYEQVRYVFAEAIAQALNAKANGKHVELLITGHSLGGAAAQAAFADLFVPAVQDVWNVTGSPLWAGDRLYNVYSSSCLQGYTEAQIQGLIQDTQVVTFGAPSFLVDPIKPTIPVLEATVVVSAGSFGIGGAGLFFSALTNFTDVASNTSKLHPDLLTSSYSSHVIQFEHVDTGDMRGDDPVPRLGNIDPGIVVPIDITTDIHDSYNAWLGPPGFEMHSMDGYLDSIARAVAGVTVTKPGAELLPTGTDGTADNELLRVGAGVAANAGPGNDILIAIPSQGATVTMNGGAGHDAYVIPAFSDASWNGVTNFNVTLDGPSGECQDILFFGANIWPHVQPVADDSDALTIVYSNGEKFVTVAITNWFSQTNTYELADIAEFDGAFRTWTTVPESLNKLGIARLSSGTAGDDYLIGSSSADSMTGQGGNDDMSGRGGDDDMHGQDGNDTLFGGSGMDTLYGGLGDDVLDGGADLDVLYGQEGNDLLRTSESGDTLDGGADNDTYEVNIPSGGTVTDTATLTDASGSDRLRLITPGATHTNTVFTVIGTDLVIEAHSASATLCTVTIMNMGTATNQIETMELVGTSGSIDNYNLVTAWNWSITHPADHTGGAASYTGLTSGYTGYADNNANTITGTTGNDVLNGYGGNDTINAGSGSDTVLGGSGDDAITLIAGTGEMDTVSGGAGTDSLAIDASGNTYAVSFWNGIDANGVTLASVDGTSSMASIQALLTGAVKLGAHTYSAGYGVVFDGIENLSIKGNANAYELLIARGSGGSYDGMGGGNDALYADWSAAATDITWINAPTGAAQTVNGNSVAGIERMVILTGSGNDSIDNTNGSVGTTPDEVVSGAGNDTISTGLGNDRIDGGDGNDTINAGSGSDTIYGGSGDDTITLSASQYNEFDVVEGGTGTNKLTVDASSNQFSVYWNGLTAANAVMASVDSTSTMASIQALLTGADKLILRTYSLGTYGVQMDDIQNLSMTGSGNNDLLLGLGANGTYVGGAGTDALYVDWSAATVGITWTNNPSGAAQTVNGTSITGVERMVILTGIGDDNIDNTNASVGVTNDEIVSGAGNDTISTGLGNDRIDGGDGNDTINAGSGSDTIYGGSGDDTITLSASQYNEFDVVEGGTGTNKLTVDASSNQFSVYWNGLTAANAVMASVDSTSTMASIQALLTGADKLILRTYSLGTYGVQMDDIQNLSMTGSGNNDLLLGLGANGTYVGGAGTDALYVDWSAATVGITWTNNPSGAAQTVNGTSITGVERMVILTGSGDDNIDNTNASVGTTN